MKKIYNHYIDKRSGFMKNTQFRVEDVFGDVISKDKFSREQITKLKNFSAKNFVNININIMFDFFKPRQKTNVDYQPSGPPGFSEF